MALCHFWDHFIDFLFFKYYYVSSDRTRLQALHRYFECMGLLHAKQQTYFAIDGRAARCRKNYPGR